MWSTPIVEQHKTYRSQGATPLRTRENHRRFSERSSFRRGYPFLQVFDEVFLGGGRAIKDQHVQKNLGGAKTLVHSG